MSASQDKRFLGRPQGQVINGTWTRNSDSAASAADLKSLASADLISGSEWTVGPNGLRYIWSTTSTLADDAFAVLQPTDAPAAGRWLLRAGQTVDLVLPVTFATADVAVLYTLPTGCRLQIVSSFWEVTLAWTGGSSSAIGVSSSNAGMSTAGDVLGGASGDVLATLVATGAFAKGTVGAKIGKPAASLSPGETLKFNRITSAFYRGHRQRARGLHGHRERRRLTDVVLGPALAARRHADHDRGRRDASEPRNAPRQRPAGGERRRSAHQGERRHRVLDLVRLRDQPRQRDVGGGRADRRTESAIEHARLRRQAHGPRAVRARPLDDDAQPARVSDRRPDGWRLEDPLRERRRRRPAGSSDERLRLADRLPAVEPDGGRERRGRRGDPDGLPPAAQGLGVRAHREGRRDLHVPRPFGAAASTPEPGAYDPHVDSAREARKWLQLLAAADLDAGLVDSSPTGAEGGALVSTTPRRGWNDNTV